MLKIRLKRVGRKHDPSFRVVLTDSRKAASKGEKELLGTYDPRRNNSKLNADKIKEWMSKGAQVSDTVYNLLVNLKIVDGKKRDVRPTIKVAEKESVVVKEAKEEGVATEVKEEETKVTE
ncbi:MAG: 30S ribosomal protein S16 [Parcubacteria group bacterium]|nr:30S ribosomal protein S16 [Parcubacteria group bacterium]MCR4342998.1 30S ribosomal protein S16 [Patescibacteria group bacterium]